MHVHVFKFVRSHSCYKIYKAVAAPKCVWVCVCVRERACVHILVITYVSPCCSQKR